MINNVTVTRRAFVQMLGAVIASTALVYAPRPSASGGGNLRSRTRAYTPKDPLAWIVVDGVKVPALDASIYRYADCVSAASIFNDNPVAKSAVAQVRTCLEFVIPYDFDYIEHISSRFMNNLVCDFLLCVPEFPGIYCGGIRLASAEPCAFAGFSSLEVHSDVIGTITHGINRML